MRQILAQAVASLMMDNAAADRMDARRRLTLRNLPNDELFRQYDAELVLRHRFPKALKEARRIIGHFRSFLGDHPPSVDLAKGYLSQFVDRKPRTLDRYAAELRTFMAWYGETLDVRVPPSKPLPEYTADEDVSRLLDAISRKSSHKKSMTRDCLLVEVAYGAGLRRSELANLKAGDIRFGERLLTVREGKGRKDRVVPLTTHLAAKLEAFCRGMNPDDIVFGLKEATITNKIATWSKKAGVDLHCHSLRHGFATRLVERGVHSRIIQELLGHESLNTTQIYTNLVPHKLREAVDLLEEPVPQAEPEREATPPEESTIRSQTLGAAHEAALHRRELVPFGRCLRDRLTLPTPEEVVRAAARGDRMAMWSGTSAWDVARDSEEERLEQEWGFERYDAKGHSLFPAFEQHLSGHACWDALDAANDYFMLYQSACLQAHTAVLERVEERVQDLTEPDARAVAGALLMDAHYRTRRPSLAGALTPRPQSVHTEDGIRWHVQVGSVGVGAAEDPGELRPLVAVCEELAGTLPSMKELMALGEVERMVRQVIEEFRSALSPDARLRRLVLEGHCDLCP